MDSEKLQSLVEDLEGNIDELEEALEPILKQSLSATTGKLPLLDKAKLYTLATYAIESILFSSLRLNGVEAKSHPISRELNRVKEYYRKIKTAETPGQKRSMKVDADAAGRLIKHGLSGNDRYDQERKERQENHKVGAKRKLNDLQASGKHTRLDAAEDDKVAEVEPSAASQSDVAKHATQKTGKRQKRDESAREDSREDDETPNTSRTNTPKSKQKVPKSSKDTFQRLLNAPLSEAKTEARPEAKDKRKQKKSKKQKGDGNTPG